MPLSVPLSQDLSGVIHAPTSKLWMELMQEIETQERENFNLRGFYREYTEAMLDNLRDLSVVDPEGKVNNDIPVFFANQERAVAKMQEDRNLRLPSVTVGIAATFDAIQRRRPLFNLNLEKKFDPQTRRAVRVISLAPKAITINFNINIWAKYIEDLNQLQELIEAKFQPAMNLKTSFGNSTFAFINYVTNQSALAVADRQDRLIQSSFLIAAEAYLPQHKYILASNGKLKKVVAPISDQ